MFEQSKIVNLVGEVIPLMQQSDDAEKTLLKFASDRNLPEAVLERMCHTFNALKTNSYMSKAASQADRGVMFSTINAPDLIKEYKAFKPNANKTASFYNISGVNKIASMKKTASNKREGSLSELTYSSLIKNKKDNKYDPIFENFNAQANIKVANTAEKELTFGEKLQQLSAKQQLLEQIIFDESVKQASIRDAVLYKTAEENWLEDLIDSGKEKTIDLYNTGKGKLSDLSDAIADKYSQLTSEESKEQFIETINKFLSMLSEKSKSVYNTVKGKAEELINGNGKKTASIKRRLVNDHTVAFKLLSSFEESAQFEKEAKALLKEASETREAMLKKADTGTFFDFTADDDDVIPAVNSVVSPDLSKIDTKITVTPVNTKGNSAVVNALQSAAADYINNLHGIAYPAVVANALVEANKQLPKKNIKQDKINKAIRAFNKELNIQKLIQEDDVISTLDKDELENTLQAYESLADLYPDLAENPAFLKGVLRTAAQLPGGVDVNSMAIMAKLYSDKLNAKLNLKKLEE